MRKGFALILLIAIIAVSIIAGGVLYWQFKSKPTPQSKQSTVIQSPSTDLSTKASAKDETANWKTYTNTLANYSVQYPSDWTVIASSNGLGVSFRKIYGIESDWNIPVSIHDNSQKLSLSAWVTQNVVEPTTQEYTKKHFTSAIKTKSVVIGKQEVILVSGARMPAANDSLQAYMVVQDKIIESGLWPYSGLGNETKFDLSGRQVLDKMVESFKFTN